MQSQQKLSQPIKSRFIDNKCNSLDKKFLINNYKKFYRLSHQIKQIQLSLNLNLASINNIADYAFIMQNYNFYNTKFLIQSSKLKNDSQAKGQKCQIPRILSENDQLKQQKYGAMQIKSNTIKIIIEPGAELIYNKYDPNKNFIYSKTFLKNSQQNIELNIEHHCFLQMYVKKMGKMDSDCIRIQLIPNTNINNENVDFNIILCRKIDWETQSDKQQQSPQFFDEEGNLITNTKNKKQMHIQ